MRGRPWSWITGRPRLADGLVVAFSALVGTIAFFGTSRIATRVPGAEILVLLIAGALWWRRSHPVPVLLVVVGIEVLMWAGGVFSEPSGPALIFAVYAVSVYDRSTVRLAVAAGAIALIVVGVSSALIGRFTQFGSLIPIGGSSLVGWVVGDYIRSRRQFFTDLVMRHRQERERTAEEERLRIARELHDVVAHNVSVIAIQAGAARVSGNSTSQTLETIEKSARDTLAELNKLLGVLRKSPAGPDLAPQPSLDDAEALLKPARDAGLEATIKVSGDRRPLPAAVDLSAYRIIQEAVTNVLKHANASRLEIIVDYAKDPLMVTTSDNGTGSAAIPATGHGLIGMRERVGLFGGDLSTGSSALGGFTVRASLPLSPPRIGSG